jgi:hypothetical protein
LSGPEVGSVSQKATYSLLEAAGFDILRNCH